MTGEGLRARIVVRRSSGFVLDIDVSIEPGTTVALLGPNGAGKSTAVSAIAGLIAVDDGKIDLAGATLDDPVAGLFVPPEQRRVGVVFQDYLLFPHLTVLDNVAFGLRSRGMGTGRARETAAGWVDRLELGDVAARRPGDLSGGQAQRVALARALATEPDLLLLDEPLSALDVTTRLELRRALGEHLAGFAGPRLLITHDPTEAFLLADRVCVIESGRITQRGSPDDIRLRPRTAFAADLAGVNLFQGTARGGVVTVAGHPIRVPNGDLEGEVLMTVHPHAISVHTSPPHGSPRNTWESTVEEIELFGDRARLRCSAPLRITAEITRGSVEEMGLARGSRVWLAIKATEIGVEAETGERQEV